MVRFCSDTSNSRVDALWIIVGRYKWKLIQNRHLTQGAGMPTFQSYTSKAMNTNFEIEIHETSVIILGANKR